MIEQRVICKCDRCDREFEQGFQQDLHPGARILLGWVPETWSYVRGELICDEHVVTVAEE